jgi:hypothetical protein
MRFTKHTQKYKKNIKNDEELKEDSNTQNLDKMMNKLTTGGNLKMMSAKVIAKKFKL